MPSSHVSWPTDSPCGRSPAPRRGPAGLPAKADVVRFRPEDPAPLLAGATKVFLYVQGAADHAPDFRP